MPREAKLFGSSSGSAVRGFLKFRANIPLRWIGNARTSWKRIEPEIVPSFRLLMRLSKNRLGHELPSRTRAGIQTSPAPLGDGS
jgi:hypothetical protein